MEIEFSFQCDQKELDYSCLEKVMVKIPKGCIIVNPVSIVPISTST